MFYSYTFSVLLIVLHNLFNFYEYSTSSFNGALPPSLPINSFISLQNAQPANGSVSRGQSRYYKLYVPAGATQLTVQTTGTGDVDLYLRATTQPTRSFYTCRSVSTSASERCVVSVPTSGDWHILVYGFGTGSSNFTLTGAYKGGIPVRVK